MVSSNRFPRRTFLASAASGAVAAAGLTACKSSSVAGASGPLAATFWGNPTILKSFAASLKAVTAADKDLTFDAQYTAYADYWNKLAVRLSGGNPPDIIEMHSSYLAEYASRGTLLALDDHADKLELSKLGSTLLAGSKVDNKTYSVPMGTQSQVVIVDTGYLDRLGAEAPSATWSWDDFAGWAADVAKAAGDGKYGTEDVGGASYAFEVFLRQNGKNLFTGDGKLGFTAADVGDYWDLWDKMRKSGAAAPAQVMAGLGAGLGESLMMVGKSAVRFDYTNNYVNATTLTDDKLNLAVYPGDGNPSKAGAYAQTAVSLAVSAKSKAADQAVEAVHLMLTNPDSVTALGLTNGLSGYPQAQKVLESKASDAEKAAIDLTKKVISSYPQPPTVPPPGSGDVSSAMTLAYQEVSYGRQSISAGASAFIKNANAKLNG